MTTEPHPGHADQVALYGVCPSCRARTPDWQGAADAIQAAGTAAAGTDPDWLRQARRVLRQLASSGQDFTADDVWHRLSTRPAEPRALGAVFREAKADGLIFDTERVQPSTSLLGHGRPVRIWRGSQATLL